MALVCSLRAPTVLELAVLANVATTGTSGTVALVDAVMAPPIRVPFLKNCATPVAETSMRHVS
jgi:hypothetical protein